MKLTIKGRFHDEVLDIYSEQLSIICRFPNMGRMTPLDRQVVCGEHPIFSHLKGSLWQRLSCPLSTSSIFLI